MRNGLFPTQPWNQKPEWRALAERVTGLLDSEELATAKRSTQYAHFTSRVVVGAVHAALDRMGFSSGTVLEPGMGIGVFRGLMPQGMHANTHYTGIELDKLTGLISKHLFPDSNIITGSFVDTKLPRDFYDVAIGNPPFAAVKILTDPEYKKYGMSLHDYFFAKSLDRVKPGGLLVFVTSRYSLDKVDPSARKYLADRADMIGAMRLPNNAFQKNAGTEVVTDIVILRKRLPGDKAAGESWLNTTPVKVGEHEYNVNEYFAAHPEMVMGKPSNLGSMYAANEYTIEPDGDLAKQLADAVARLPANVFSANQSSEARQARTNEVDFNPNAKKIGNFYLSNGKLFKTGLDGLGHEIPVTGEDAVSAKSRAIITSYIPLRDALKAAHHDQLNDGDWQGSLKALNAEYKRFVDKHGLVNQFTTHTTNSVDEDGETTTVTRFRYPLLKVIKEDPDHTLVMALENVDEENEKITPSRFLSERSLMRPVTPVIQSAQDAMNVVLAERGRVDMKEIAARIGMDEDAVIESLGESIYQAPDGQWQTADEYLSGDVVTKLDEALAAAKADARLQRNVDALKERQPRPILKSDIKASLGMNWIPTADINQFAMDMLGVRAAVKYDQALGNFTINLDGPGQYGPRNVKDWAGGGYTGGELISTLLDRKTPKVTRKTAEGKREIDAVATEAAQAAAAKLADEFRQWAWRDEARGDRLAEIYNSKYNRLVGRVFNGDHLLLPGVTLTFKPHPHVKRAIWRIIQQGNVYLAHGVGAGKTAEMIIASQEEKRLGLIRKPMFVVPNHMLRQFSREFMEIYPAARLMVADEQEFHTENRRRFVSKAALSDLDGIVITHSAFKLLDVDPVFKAEMIQQELNQLQDAMDNLDDSDRVKRRDYERRIEGLEQVLGAAASSAGKDKNARFDEMGVDKLYVDEAHEFRKLSFTTERGNIKGISSEGSGKARDLYIKTRWLEKKYPGRSLVMASGTPITNTMAELYTVQRFMNEKQLVKDHLEHFDDWASLYGEEKTSLEADAAGKYGPVTRFAKFVNLPDLAKRFRDFADVITGTQLGSLLSTRPKVVGGGRKINVVLRTRALADYQKELASRMEAIKNRKGPPKPGDDILLSVIGDGRLASIDMRFVRPGLPNNPHSKLNVMIDAVIGEYKQTADNLYNERAGKNGVSSTVKGGTQMVFSDMGFGAGVTARGFNARAWFESRLKESGIPTKHIAFMSDYDTHAKKAKLFQDMNAGRVRILIGSSKNMGTGVNAQNRLTMLHHLDTPWYPADLEQREGRIIRHGNQNPLVRVEAYSTKGTYDTVMWQMVASKQAFIEQVLNGDESMREMQDLSDADQMTMAVAMTSGDERAIELAGLQADVSKLSRLSQAHEDKMRGLRTDIRVGNAALESFAKEIPKLEAQAAKVQPLTGDAFTAKVGKQTITKVGEFGQTLIERFDELRKDVFDGEKDIGEISGFTLFYRGMQHLDAKGALVDYSGSIFLNRAPHPAYIIKPSDVQPSGSGIGLRAINAVAAIAKDLEGMRQNEAHTRQSIKDAQDRVGAKFDLAATLQEKTERIKTLEADLAAGTNVDTEEFADDGAIEQAAMFSRGAGRGMSKDEVTTAVRAINKVWTNAPTTIVLASMKEAPVAVQAEDMKQRRGGADGSPRGFVYNGKVYIVASEMGSVKDVAETMLHEIAGHYGLRRAFGAELTAILADVARLRNADVLAKAKQYGLDATVERNLMRAAEEVLAEMAETEPTAGLVRRAIAAIRKFLRQFPMFKDMKLSDNDIIVNYLIPARDSLRNGVDGKKFSGVPAFSRATNTPMANDKTVVGNTTGRSADDGKERGARSAINALSDRAGYEGVQRTATPERPVKVEPASMDGAAASEVKRTPFAQETEMLPRGALTDKLLALRAVPDKMNRPHVYKVLALINEASKSKTLGSVAVFDAAKAEMKSLIEQANALTDNPSLKGFVGSQWGSVPKQKAVQPVVRASSPKPSIALSAIDGLLQKADQATDQSERLDTALDAMKLAVRNGSTAAEDLFWQARDIAQSVVEEANSKLESDFLTSGVFKNPENLMRNRDVIEIIRNGENPQWGIHDHSAKFDRATLNIVSSGNWSIDRLTNTADFKNANELTTSQDGDVAFSRTAAATAKPDTPKFGLIDTPLRVALEQSKLINVWRGAFNLLEKTASMGLSTKMGETFKAGVVDKYGVPDAVIDRRASMYTAMGIGARDVRNVIDKMGTLTRAESAVLYRAATTADSAEVNELIKELPNESQDALREIKAMVRSLGQEQVRLGNMTADTFARNEWSYLHRSYQKYELAESENKGSAASRTLRTKGDQYKGRGMFEPVTAAELQAWSPVGWKAKFSGGKIDPGMIGQKFIRLEAREKTVPIDGENAVGKLKDVAYVPSDQPIPAKYDGYTQDAGAWELRQGKGNNVSLWRDFTPAERTRMGEIDDIRYGFVKTMALAIHDTEVGKYFEWVGSRYAKIDESQLPKGAEVLEASERMVMAYRPGTWVHVPTSKIPGTSVAKYGKLADTYIPGPIWNDIRQAGQTYKPFGAWHDSLLKFWKLNKTALSLGVHTNNVMSNFIMADWAELNAGHLFQAVNTLVKPNATQRAMYESYLASGAEGGSYALTELQQSELAALLKEVEADSLEAQGHNGLLNISAALGLIREGQMRQAAKALTASKTAAVPKKLIDVMVNSYQMEDTVFRLAAFIKAKNEGKSDTDAGSIARKAFLDYDISAPWVKAARATALPFVAFSYRAIPKLYDVAKNKPWKLIKLMAAAGALNSFGYLMSGGDEDDERGRLAREKAGKVWNIVPKLIRMPWNDANGNPVFLDVRRWIPAGDILDTDQQHGAFPIPPFLNPGGPLFTLMELLANKSNFTGKPIVNDTDTTGEKSAKILDHAYKSVMPNVPIPTLGNPLNLIGMDLDPGQLETYSWTSIANANKGVVDAFGRERSMQQALLSAVGVKVAGYPADVANQSTKIELDTKTREIMGQAKAYGRMFSRNGLDQAQYDARTQSALEKMQKASEEAQKRMGR